MSVASLQRTAPCLFPRYGGTTACTLLLLLSTSLASPVVVGKNREGQLFIESPAATAPTAIQSPIPGLHGETPVQISVGAFHTVVRSKHWMAAAGDNLRGQSTVADGVTSRSKAVSAGFTPTAPRPFCHKGGSTPPSLFCPALRT